MPKLFHPNFWVGVGHNHPVIKEIKERYQTLLDNASIDSYQKELIAQRIVFIAAKLETMETDVMLGEAEFNIAAYTRLTNILSNLLAKVGLKNKKGSAPWLQAFPTKPVIDGQAVHTFGKTPNQLMAIAKQLDDQEAIDTTAEVKQKEGRRRGEVEEADKAAEGRPDEGDDNVTAAFDSPSSGSLKNSNKRMSDR